MEGVEKWSVTYTKQIKQKRKVYQDGFLELDALSHKVILFDDCENILQSRFVKKEDIIKSGQTLVFDCYLVDIGDLLGDQKPLPKFNTKVTMTSKSFQSPKLDRRQELDTEKARVRNLSPSQKIIREFKKSEMTKYSCSPSSCATAKSSKVEWQVLYTTQITQKAKKYRDGILQLLVCGSQKQILLYDANRRHLESRFLRKDEIIRTGEAITFDGHLVNVGEREGDNKPLMDSNLEGRNCNAHGETKAGNENIHFENKFPVELQKEASSRKHFNSNTHCSIDQHKISSLGDSRKPVRAVQEILSTLKKPMTQKDVAVKERESAEGYRASQSSHTYNFDARNQIEQPALQDICPEGGKVVDLNEESTMHEQSDTSKTEAIKILSNEILASEEEEFLIYAFSTGSACISKDTVDMGCTNTGETSPDPSTVEPNLLVAMELDLKGQQPSAPVLQDHSTEILEKGHCTKPVSCKEDLIGAIPAAPGIPIPFFQEVGPNNITKPCADGKQIDARWDTRVDVIGMEKSNDCTSYDFYDDKLKIPEQDISTEKEDDLPSFDLGF